ncbi:MAG: RAMP superfamily CRISPR-associated protein, partial [Conexivisphaera sp.]
MPNLILSVLNGMNEGMARCVAERGPREGDRRGTKYGDPIEECRRAESRRALDMLIKGYSEGSGERFGRIQGHLRDLEDALRRTRLKYVRVDMITRSKLVLGWSPLYFISEVPLAWDMILDTFYIPASTVKGILKSALRTAGSGCEKELMGDKGFVGGIAAFDAYPVEARGRALTLDVLTPHYRPNVSNEYEVEPIPVVHAVVSPGVRFRTFLAYDGKRIRGCD